MQQEGEFNADVQLGPELLTSVDDPSRHQLVLDVSFRSPKGAPVLPYDFRVRGRAFFHLSGNLEPDQAASLVVLNGSAILLGLLRAQVAQVTAQGPHGAFLIPPLNLVEAFAESVESAPPSSPAEIAGDATD